MLLARPSCPYRVDVDLWNGGRRQGLSVAFWYSQCARRSAFHWHPALGWVDGGARRPLRDCMSSAVRSVLLEAPDPADLDLFEGQLSDPAGLHAALHVMES